MITTKEQENKSEVTGTTMKAIIKNKIEELLSKEFYCSPEDLNGKSTAYSVNSNAKQPYIKMLAYRKQ